jgi:hypothetical protein
MSMRDLRARLRSFHLRIVTFDEIPVSLSWYDVLDGWMESAETAPLKTPKKEFSIFLDTSTFFLFSE